MTAVWVWPKLASSRELSITSRCGISGTSASTASRCSSAVLALPEHSVGSLLGVLRT
jgi:hypothetical protein